MASKFRNAGQTCICANRIYVQAGIYDEFVEKFTASVRDLKVGNGLVENVDIGPLINQAGLDKVSAQVKDAIEKGASGAVGGEEMLKKEGGSYKKTEKQG